MRGAGVSQSSLSDKAAAQVGTLLPVYSFGHFSTTRAGTCLKWDSSPA
jgi:hypothetical protein